MKERYDIQSPEDDEKDIEFFNGFKKGIGVCVCIAVFIYSIWLGCNGL